MKRQILYVEDNPGDVQLVMEAFEGSPMANEFNITTDGEQAMEYLGRLGKFTNAVRPELILLDLNLPKKDGREVLAQIKMNNELKSIPVVVLSSSGSERDILSAYDHHANCYIQKPLNFDDFVKAVNRIDEFWLKIVKLPAMN